MVHDDILIPEEVDAIGSEEKFIVGPNCRWEGFGFDGMIADVNVCYSILDLNDIEIISNAHTIYDKNSNTISQSFSDISKINILSNQLIEPGASTLIEFDSVDISEIVERDNVYIELIYYSPNPDGFSEIIFDNISDRMVFTIDNGPQTGLTKIKKLVTYNSLSNFINYENIKMTRLTDSNTASPLMIYEMNILLEDEISDFKMEKGHPLKITSVKDKPLPYGIIQYWEMDTGSEGIIGEGDTLYNYDNIRVINGLPKFSAKILENEEYMVVEKSNLENDMGFSFSILASFDNLNMYNNYHIVTDNLAGENLVDIFDLGTIDNENVYFKISTNSGTVEIAIPDIFEDIRGKFTLYTIAYNAITKELSLHIGEKYSKTVTLAGEPLFSSDIHIGKPDSAEKYMRSGILKVCNVMVCDRALSKSEHNFINRKFITNDISIDKDINILSKMSNII